MLNRGVYGFITHHTDLWAAVVVLGASRPSEDKPQQYKIRLLDGGETIKAGTLIFSRNTVFPLTGGERVVTQERYTAFLLMEQNLERLVGKITKDQLDQLESGWTIKRGEEKPLTLGKHSTLRIIEFNSRNDIGLFEVLEDLGNPALNGTLVFIRGGQYLSYPELPNNILVGCQITTKVNGKNERGQLLEVIPCDKGWEAVVGFEKPIGDHSFDGACKARHAACVPLETLVVEEY